MDYHTVYKQICDRARSREREPGVYYEKHHVVPKCLGGTDNSDNLVLLTYREHFLCHALLVKMHTGQAYYKMLYALNGMQRINDRQQRSTSRLYDYFRQKFVNMKSESMRNNNPMKNEKHRETHALAVKQRNSPGMTGKNHTTETRSKMRKKQLGKPVSEETKRKLSEINKRKAQEPGYINPERIGWYITPWGRFESLSKAAEGKPCNRISIKNWCRINNNKKITSLNLRNNSIFTEADIGKTYADLGFGFEEL